MTVVAYVPDLMDRSRVSAVVPDVAFVGRPEGLAAAVASGDVALVDLGRAGALEVLPRLLASGARVIAFGAHVDQDTLDAARAAGCEEVLARSAVFRTLGDLVNPT